MDEETDEWMNEKSGVFVGDWQLTNAGLIFMDWLYSDENEEE